MSDTVSQEWTAEEKNRSRGGDAGRNKKSSEEAFGSEQYWDWVMQENIAEGQINDLR